MIVILPTAEEAAAIRQGDRELIDHYYLLNRKFIERVAKNYCWHVTNFKDWEDLAQEAYLHFDRFDFSSPRYFCRCLKDCFWAYRLGGMRKYNQLYDRNNRDRVDPPEWAVLDAPAVDLEDRDVLDLIPSDFDVYEELEPEPDISDPDMSERLYTRLCDFLSPEQKKIFTYLYYTGLTQKEIGKETGKNENTVRRTKMNCMDKFRKHADELREWLTDQGLPPAA